MNAIKCADLVWVATAILSRDHPDRNGFSTGEIRGKIDEIEPGNGFAPSTVPTHIAVHCVANKPPDSLKHRKLYLNPDRTYRLYRPGDKYDPGRNNGETLPQLEQLPPKYRALIEWYRATLVRPSDSVQQEDPILALQGVGKELWRSLGGGEKFIRELRENWYGTASALVASEERPRHKKAG
jgi:hypothetical protein